MVGVAYVVFMHDGEDDYHHQTTLKVFLDKGKADDFANRLTYEILLGHIVERVMRTIMF